MPGNFRHIHEEVDFAISSCPVVALDSMSKLLTGNEYVVPPGKRGNAKRARIGKLQLELPLLGFRKDTTWDVV